MFSFIKDPNIYNMLSYVKYVQAALNILNTSWKHEGLQEMNFVS